MPPTNSLATVSPYEDYFQESTSSDQYVVEFLLPFRGLTIPIECSRDTTLYDARELLWLEIRNKSFHKWLKSPDDYTFTSQTLDSDLVEFYNLNKRICDLNLFYPFFQLVESQGDNVEKAQNANIWKAIGLHTTEIDKVSEYDNEICHFRIELFKNLQITTLATKRAQSTEAAQNALIDCVYAPNLELDPTLFDTSMTKAVDSMSQFSVSGTSKKPVVTVCIHVQEESKPKITYCLDNVSLERTPTDLVAEIIKTKLSEANYNEKQITEVIHRYRDSYILKVCGCDEIFFSSKNQIGTYRYIQECVEHTKKAHFFLISLENLKSKLPAENESLLKTIEKNLLRLKTIEQSQKQQVESSKLEVSWSSKETFKFFLGKLSFAYLIRDTPKLYVEAAIYHGQERVSRVITSKTIDNDLNNPPVWNELIDLKIEIKHLHRCARLCLCLSGQIKKKEPFTIGFVSINLFDYKGYLLYDKKSLNLWQTNNESTLGLFSSETTANYGEGDSVLTIDVGFSLDPSDRRYIYPNSEQITRFINRTSDTTRLQDDCLDVSYALENDNSLLESILNKDALAELTEQDKSVLWKRRGDCLNYPHSLPKLLQSVKWTNQEGVIEAYSLLYKWPDVKPVVAFELLNPMYQDIEVRTFAVRCLDRYMKNEEVKGYLIQLVQALKNEPYYDNALTKFLLSRALKSQRVGFDLFWLLKTEMGTPKYKYRFALILEAYCRGIGEQLQTLLKQVDAVDKLSHLAQIIKNNKDAQQGSFLEDNLKKNDYKEALSNFICPLNRSHLLGEIQAAKGKILTSAKKPMYLLWKNGSEFSECYQEVFELIFKKGDDLRQDMLTLQILKLMDIMWKSEGLDLKMLVYDCFSTGSKVGFIQVVKDSKTLFKIMTEDSKRAQFQYDTSHLYKWICSHNEDEKDLNEAVETFTKSCAGYCVATYILGIADRHPDNIMVNKSGRLFHIDFGHFLGNFKMKAGFKRERVPFVLTEDFAYVITRGAQQAVNTKEFADFKKLCINAYMTMRKHAHLIINLFSLMTLSEMPELNSFESLMYLRKSLALDESDATAKETFISHFNESYSKSHNTKIDWFFHALNDIKKSTFS